MKSFVKGLLSVAGVAAVAFLLFSFSCVGTVSSSKTGANTVYAESSPAYSMSEEALSVVEALQSAFRTVSGNVLPSVVEVDVTQVVQQTTSSGDYGFPFYYFFDFGNRGDETREYTQDSLGSGVIVRRTGNTYYVLTNEHVAGDASTIKIKLYDNTEFEGKLVGSDERKDIALVSFESDEPLTVAKLGDSDAVQVGDICFAMGTPLGYASSVSQGIISAKSRSGSSIGNISDFLQTDAAINQGNSGGPLVNIYGEIIGINTWIASQSGGSQGLGFSIPINNIKKAIDDFINDGKVTYGWLGASLTSLTNEYLDTMGLKGHKGAFVANVFMDSPAYKCGLQAGDFIIALNGKNVVSVDQLVLDVGDLTVGEKAAFTVIRGGKEMSLTATIENRKDTDVSDNSKLWPGFSVAELTEDVRKQLKIDNDVKGVVVTNIQSKSPASAMRLQNYDIITAVNDNEVTNVQEFYKELDLTGKTEIWFDVYNEGHTITTGKYKLNRK
ncbi:MAG: Do family serine endopeptidase [Treponemataceae bacterium]|nr:Do family serine endopeptidase [Treponemataceae bacterium]